MSALRSARTPRPIANESVPCCVSGLVYRSAGRRSLRRTGSRVEKQLEQEDAWSSVAFRDWALLFNKYLETYAGKLIYLSRVVDH
ncbi:hypothetical protein AGOR_G00251100 [Albula goreensis]|uniref:Uncharacterized protein n=1 Tax=Albula goreensis TaxID=1534307 RepID=A0A8T3CEK9_9TELE|nr:hypothetical protein AGOR_G00251100 [Albula goreensis]